MRCLAKLSIVCVTCFLLVNTTAVAQSKGKAPWELTDSERIILRVASAQTVQRLGGSVSGGSISTTATSGAPFVIHGGQSPELLMPSQLVSSLLTSVDQSERDSNYRDRLHARHAATVQRLGWVPDEFWNTLSQRARSYNTLISAAGRNRSETASIGICRARIATLHELRERFPRFDEFLYSAIAPDMTMATDVRESVEHLSWLEKGCQ
jgi:hypothetical protein